jgi:hypothetical protein
MSSHRVGVAALLASLCLQGCANQQSTVRRDDDPDKVVARIITRSQGEGDPEPEPDPLDKCAQAGIVVGKYTALAPLALAYIIGKLCEAKGLSQYQSKPNDTH